MLDPFPPPPDWLRTAITPFANWASLPSLPHHIHQVTLAFTVYLTIHFILSPLLSPILFPASYPNFNRRTKLNWDVHAVSFVQSVLINTAALWVMFCDEERRGMGSSLERVYGYTGACGVIQALATGYFIYDLLVSAVYVRIFGLGMVFHGVSALWVFALGFRPFVNFYTPVFILYELSSPFLNIHWFLDKVNMTGSKAQWYNGMLLLSTFFFCRLVWGTWRSFDVYIDMWNALSHTWSWKASHASGNVLDPTNINAQVFVPRVGGLCVDETCARAQAQISKYAATTAAGTPTWLVATYVLSNIVLNSLNYYWFSKMIETVLKRFRGPPAGAAAKPEKKGGKEKNESEKAVLDAAAELEREQGNGGLPVGGAGKGEALRKRKVDPLPTS